MKKKSVFMFSPFDMLPGKKNVFPPRKIALFLQKRSYTSEQF